MLLTIIKGINLIETIWFNTIPFNRIGASLGKPVWEYDNVVALSDEIANAWFARLVPLARFVKLGDNCQNMILANGIKYSNLYEDGTRETMATLCEGKEKGKTLFKYLRTNLERSPWRDLYSILSVGETSRQSGSLALKNISLLLADENVEQQFHIWLGGFVTDQAKVIDSAFWNIGFSAELYQKANLSKYQDGVIFANVAEKRLIGAITKGYCQSLKLDSQKESSKSKTSLVVRAKKLFWTTLEREQHILEQEACELKLEKWHKILKKTIENVYERVCPHMTARQIQAFTVGKRELHFSEKKPQNKGKTSVS